MTDIFLSRVLDWERKQYIEEIELYADYLFQIFDILFGVFVAVICLAIGYVGFFYIRKNLQRQIVQIYHIVMLIPYGDRTRTELDELIKFDL